MNRRPDFVEKCTNLIKAAILFYQSSLERKNFMKLKKTQLFTYSYQVNEIFAVKKACMRKTKRGIGIIFFSQKVLLYFVALHRKHFESFIWEVP